MSLTNRLASMDPGVVTPTDTFDIKLYDGNRPSTVTVNSFNFSPDLVVIKDRDANDFWSVLDTTRGQNVMSWDATDAQSNFSGGFSFVSNGFSVTNTGQANTNGNKYVAYGWRANGGTTSSNSDGDITSTVQANVAAGFSIVTHTNSGNKSDSVGHGLGVAPKMLITKKYNTTTNWWIYTTVVDGSMDYVIMNGNAAKVDTSTVSVPTSSVFYNESGGADSEPYVTYCFADIDGLRKIGYYTGDGGTSHSINVGFEPDFLMFIPISNGDNRMVFDSVRGGTSNNNKVLFPNLNYSERNPNLGNGLNFTSTGFDLLSSDGAFNGSSKTYMYWAEKIVT